MSGSSVPWMVPSVEVIEREPGSSTNTLSRQLAGEPIDARLKDEVLGLAISERGHSQKHPVQGRIS